MINVIHFIFKCHIIIASPGRTYAIASVLGNLTIMNAFLGCGVIGKGIMEETGLMKTLEKRCHFSIT